MTATIDASATGTLVNTATVAVPAGTTDPDPTDNSATDTDTLTPRADLSITKTDGTSRRRAGNRGDLHRRGLERRAVGVAGATVTDLLPADLLAATWTCAAVGGSCPASGSGDIVANIDLAVGGTATFTIIGNGVAGGHLHARQHGRPSPRRAPSPIRSPATTPPPTPTP